MIYRYPVYVDGNAAKSEDKFFCTFFQGNDEMRGGGGRRDESGASDKETVRSVASEEECGHCRVRWILGRS